MKSDVKADKEVLPFMYASLIAAMVGPVFASAAAFGLWQEKQLASIRWKPAASCSCVGAGDSALYGCSFPSFLQEEKRRVVKAIAERIPYLSMFSNVRYGTKIDFEGDLFRAKGSVANLRCCLREGSMPHLRRRSVSKVGRDELIRVIHRFESQIGRIKGLHRLFDLDKGRRRGTWSESSET